MHVGVYVVVVVLLIVQRKKICGMIGKFPIRPFVLYNNRYGHNGPCGCNGYVKKNISTRSKYRRSHVLRSASASDSPHFNNVTRDSSCPEFYQQVPMLIS